MFTEVEDCIYRHFINGYTNRKVVMGAVMGQFKNLTKNQFHQAYNRAMKRHIHSPTRRRKLDEQEMGKS